MDLKALIFDVDGTIAETEETHRQAFNATFAEYNTGWNWSPELYRDLLTVNGGAERIRRYLELHHPSMLQYEHTEVLIRMIHRDKTARYVKMLNANGLPLRPGVLRLFSEARAQGVRLAIATTTNRVNVHVLLRNAIGLQAVKWFEVIGSAESVPRKKPAPDIYNYALSQLGLPASACLAIEDSPNGLAAACAAGLPTVVTEGHYFSGTPFPGALAILSDLGEPGQPFSIRPDSPNRNLSLGDQWVTLNLLRRWYDASKVRAAS